MRKIIVFLFFLLAFFTYLGAPQPSLAACEIELVSPPGNTIKKDFQGTISLKTKNDKECFGISVPYKVIMYPQSKTLKDVSGTISTGEGSNISYGPVTSEDISSTDGKTFVNAKVNFNDEKIFFPSYQATLKPHDIESWKMLVCPQKSSSQCDKDPIAAGSFQLGLADPTPTPTLAPDQPMINAFKQVQCVFQYTNDPDFTASISAQLQKPNNKTYKWWWNESGWFVLPTIQETGLQPDSNGNLEIKIKGTMLKELTDPTKKNGNDLCVDVAGKGAKGERLDNDFGGQRRTGPNCVKIFFTNGNPIEQNINTSCSGANRVGEPKTPPPPPPQCAYWTYLNGTPVPTREPDKEKGLKGTQSEYIQYNNIKLDGLKCEQVNTAVGSINTEPIAFIRSIFSIVLGLSGGIALILIIISGYRFMVSQGNPEVIKGAQQQLMGAIIGLLFIIFSFVILQVVGVDILRIPGFNP